MSAENPPEAVINLEMQEEVARLGWRSKLGRIAAVSTLLASGLGIGWANSDDTIKGETIASIEPAAQGSYNNAAIADKALSYVGHLGSDACRDAHMLDSDHATTVGGYDGGECRTFINCIIKMVSDGSQNIGWGQDDYFAALKASGQEITDVNALKKGDIVQQGQGIHTFIIVGHNSGNSFDVVDSNSVGRYRVGEHDRSVTLDANQRAFRLGKVVSPPAPPKPKPQPAPFDASKYKNHIVEWNNGPDEQHTAWLVDGDGKRRWIPDIPTFWCLRGKGIPDDGVQSASVLDHLPDSGQQAECIPGLDDAVVAPAPMDTIPPMSWTLPEETPAKPSPTAPPPTTPPSDTAPPVTEKPPATQPQPKRILLHVYNKVTNGSTMREDSTPVRLTRSPHPYCNDDCIAGSERSTGDSYDAAVCQTHGPYDTNGNNHDSSDDHNPGRYESTLYYGVREADGTFGYTSDVWVASDQRGGMGLPTC